MERVTDSQIGGAGGLDTTSDDLAMGDRKLRRATNARLSRSGAITKRGGTRRLSDSVVGLGAVRGGYHWADRGAGALHLIASANGSLYTASGWRPWTFTSIGTGLSATERCRFAQFIDAGGNDCVYFVHNSVLKRTDGSTITLPAGSPSSLVSVWVYNRRLYAFGADSATLYWSGIDDGDSLGNAASGGGAAALRTSGDSNIAAARVIGGASVIALESGVAVLTGLTQEEIAIQSGSQGLSSDIGCVGPDAFAVAGNIGYMLSSTGVYAVTPQQLSLISGDIETTLAGLDQTDWEDVQAIANPRHSEVWFQFPGIGLYVFNFRLNAWAGPWNDGLISPDITAMWNATDSTGRDVVLLGDASGYVREADATGIVRDNVAASATTGGDVINLDVKFRRMFPATPDMEKSLRFGFLVGTAGGSSDLTLHYETRSGSDSYDITDEAGVVWGVTTGDRPMVWGNFTWGVPSTLDAYRVPMGGRGTWVDVWITDGGDGSPVVSRFDIVAFALRRWAER